jgi:hypothetical protein
MQEKLKPAQLRKIKFPDLCEDMRRQNTIFLLPEISHGRQKDVLITNKVSVCFGKRIGLCKIRIFLICASTKQYL